MLAQPSRPTPEGAAFLGLMGVRPADVGAVGKAIVEQHWRGTIPSLEEALPHTLL